MEGRCEVETEDWMSIKAVNALFKGQQDAR